MGKKGFKYSQNRIKRESYLLEADMGESLNLRAENSLELAVDSALLQ